MLPFWTVALLGFLAVARVTRFLNRDKLFEPVVDRIEAWARRGRPWRAKLSYLVTCPWCASIWTAFPTALIAVVWFSPLHGRWAVAAVLGLWLGYSWLYGLIASNLDDE